MSKKILCVDFDGVIHSYTSPWVDEMTIPDPPVEGAIEFLLKASEEFDVVIHSSRFSSLEAVNNVYFWLVKNGIPSNIMSNYDGHIYYKNNTKKRVVRIFLAMRKPPAFLTIDDRAITFTGTWPDIEEIKKFKPWNKK